MNEDLSTWYDGEFSVELTTATRRKVNVIFDEESVEVGDVGVDSTAPSFSCPTCNFALVGIRIGDEVAIRDRLADIDHGRFIVREIKAMTPIITFGRLERISA